jgi:hypothetical protein
MRTARRLGGLVLVLVTAISGRAQTPTVAEITVQEVEVRSGPSTNANYYATCKLYRGDKVTVVRDYDKDWLAIQPPRPGRDSFSWVNARDVQDAGAGAVFVKVAEAPIRVGSRLLNQPPTVEGARAKKGTVLTVIGQTETAPDGTWLPILPAPTEVRYLPVSALRAAAPTAQQTAAPPIASATPTFTQPITAVTAPSAAAPVSQIEPPLLVRAKQADLAGAIPDAIRLYEQAARETGDPELRIKCLNRSQFLRDALAASDQRRAQAYQASLPGRTVEGRLTSLSSTPPAPATTVTTVPQRPPLSQYCYVPEPCASVRLRPPILNTPPPPLAASTAGPASPPQPQWHGPGRLIRTSFFLDGKPAYRFEPATGQMWSYVTAGPDVELGPYDGKSVNLYGMLAYHGELRTSSMSVLQVSSAQ